MLHMRPYNTFENRNVKYLVDKQIEFATIQITQTGFKKSILDATAPVRAYLKEQGIHDYDTQLQGTDHKRFIETYILTEETQYKTKTSLYRPMTKRETRAYGLIKHGISNFFMQMIYLLS